MHCPRCGQQQISDQTKFCSRCGFQLGLVAEILVNNGYLPQLAELYKGKSTIFTRRNGALFSAVWFIFWLMLTIFFGIADIEEGAAFSIIFGIFTSLILLIISLATFKRSPKPYELAAQQMQMQQTPHALHGNPQMHVLPQQQTQPASTYMPPEGSWRAPDTGDLARRPGSVTESTTKLLKKDE